jgi:hypothetical protein
MTPLVVAVDNAFLYWTNGGGSIGRCPLAGCADAGAFATTTGSPRGIAVDDQSLYWTDSTAGAVYVCDLAAGCAAHTGLAQSQNQPSAIAVDSAFAGGAARANAYWTNYGDGTVMTCSVAACSTPTKIATGQGQPRAIAVDVDRVYWGSTDATNGGLMACARPDCPGGPTRLAKGQPWAIAIDGANVYWLDAEDGTLKRVAK